MFGLEERPYPAQVLISFWCDSGNKNFDFLTFQNFCGYFSFIHFGYHQNFILVIIKICQFSYTPLLGLFLNICSMHIGPKEFSR